MCKSAQASWSPIFSLHVQLFKVPEASFFRLGCIQQACWKADHYKRWCNIVVESTEEQFSLESHQPSVQLWGFSSFTPSHGICRWVVVTWCELNKWIVSQCCCEWHVDCVDFLFFFGPLDGRPRVVAPDDRVPEPDCLCLLLGVLAFSSLVLSRPA